MKELASLLPNNLGLPLSLLTWAEIDERYPAVEGAVLDLDQRPGGPVSPDRSS